MNENEIIINKLNINDIPVIVCYKKDSENLPVIIFSHGFRGSKEDFLDDMNIYAKNNLFTISIDNRGHGERKEKHFSEYAFKNAKLNILKVRKLINETAKDIPEVINYLEKNHHVDAGRIGMSGISMGGFTTFRALTLETRIKIASLFISSPIWDELPKTNKKPLIDTIELRKKLKEYSKENAPVNFIEKFYDKKILLQLGKDDKHIDIEKVRRFVNKVNKHNSDIITIIEYENVAHEVTAEMKRKALDWIKKVL